MKNVIITGATGMVGNIILHHCLDSEQIHQVTSISRRSTGIDHPKLKEIIHTDFLDYSEIESAFEKQDVAYFCIGVYTGAVNREKFREITVDYTKVFADCLLKNSPMATFCFLSGAGADHSGKAKMAFAIDKGIAEKYLLQLDLEQLYIFRPAYIYPSEPRQEPNISYKIMYVMYPLMKIIYPKSQITSNQLGEAMFKTGLYGGRETILENQEIKWILKS